MTKTANTMAILGTSFLLLGAGFLESCSMNETKDVESSVQTTAARTVERTASAAPFDYRNVLSAAEKNAAAQTLVDSFSYSGSEKEVNKLKSQIYLAVTDRGMTEDDAQTTLHTKYWNLMNNDGKITSAEKAQLANCINALAAQNRVKSEVY